MKCFLRKIYSFYNRSVRAYTYWGDISMSWFISSLPAHWSVSSQTNQLFMLKFKSLTPWFVSSRTKPFKPFFSLLILLSLLCFNASATDIYVSINGSDTNLGTKEKPLATLHSAMRKARELRRLKDTSIKGGIRIIMGKGFYQLHEPIVLRPEDSGTKDSPTEIIANEKVVLSGGVKIKGWKKLNGAVVGLPKEAMGNGCTLSFL